MSDIAGDVSATVTEQTAPSPSASSDKGRELQEAHDEIKALKLSVEQLTEERAKLKKKLKSKNIEINKIVEEKKALRRALAARKDGDGLLKATDNVLRLEAKLKLARSELEKLKKDNTALDRPKKSKIDYAEKHVKAAKSGGKDSKECTLILTEGDSAKALVMAGLSALSCDSRAYFGVFPLQGKLLNVKKASEPQLKENEQINQLKNILGLENGEDYKKNLKYGQVMIMTDQDDDGFHIKGLIISLFHSLWPELLKTNPSFLSELVTPVVKVTYKDGREGISFFSMVEFNRWKESNGSGQGSAWDSKQYKGLGTSTDEEAKDYFRNLQSYKREFLWKDDGKDEEAINLAFSKNAEERRTWLNKFEPDKFLDRKNLDKIRYCDFVYKELILYAIADNARSIPCLLDGFKPSQRKAIFCLFQRKLQEYKVSELAAFVSENSGYFHCEQSLAATIIKMAQDYIGAKNINFLLGIGQFGTRTAAGKDAASPRYIFTKLSPLTRFLFPKEDDVLLAHENGNEPITYIPIIPTILVNGCEGIGTGYKTFVPRYSSKDIISKIKFLLGGGDPNSIKMTPSYEGFNGKIDIQQDGEFKSKGVYEVRNFPKSDEHKEIHITELPICPKPNYKKFLRGLKTEDGKKPFIEEIQDNSTKWTVDYKLKVSKENIVDGEDLYEKLRLQTTLRTTNMHLADHKTKEIKKYKTPGKIFAEFYPIRLDYYEKRKTYLINILETKLEKLSNIKRFIGEFLEATTFRNKDVEDLKKGNYSPIPDGASGYDYLLVDVTLAMISHEKVAELAAEMGRVEEEINVLSDREPKDLWLADLDLLEKELDLLEKELAKLSTPEEAREEAHELQKHELPAGSKKRPTEDRESLDKSPDKKEARLGEID